MLSALTTFAVGCLFGLAFAAPPGPMNALIAEESVLRGWLAGFKTGVGAMSADVCFFLLALGGVVAVVTRHAALEHALFLVGGLLMLYFAFDAIRDALASSAFVPDERERGDAAGFRKAFVLSLTNPYQLSFWLTIGVGMLRPGTLAVTEHAPALEPIVGSLVVETGSATLLLGFFGGIGFWIVAYPAALVLADRRVDAFAPIVAGASALVLGGFGLSFCWLGVVGLVG